MQERFKKKMSDKGQPKTTIMEEPASVVVMIYLWLVMIDRLVMLNHDLPFKFVSLF